MVVEKQTDLMLVNSLCCSLSYLFCTVFCTKAATCWSDVTQSAAGVVIVRAKRSDLETWRPTIPDKHHLILAAGGCCCYYWAGPGWAAPSTDVTGVISLPVCGAKRVIRAAAQTQRRPWRTTPTGAFHASRRLGFQISWAALEAEQQNLTLSFRI